MGMSTPQSKFFYLLVLRTLRKMLPLHEALSSNPSITTTKKKKKDLKCETLSSIPSTTKKEKKVLPFEPTTLR
jgi:hypothetical protein